jgi:putative DNA primase/helicase
MEDFKPGLRPTRYTEFDIDEMSKQIRAECKTKNVYFGPALMRKDLAKGRGKIEDVTCLLSLVLEEDLDTGKTLVLPAGIEPTFIIETSRVPTSNRHFHYVFDVPLGREPGIKLAKLAREKCGGDSCNVDVAHVWRVPGTLNHPDWRKLARGRPPEPQAVELIGGTGQPIEARALRAALASMPSVAIVYDKETTAWISGGELDANALRSRLPEKLRADLDTEGENNDRSGHCAAVMLALFERKFTDDEALVLAEEFEFAEKFRERGDEGLRKEIARVRGLWAAKGAQTIPDFDDLDLTEDDELKYGVGAVVNGKLFAEKFKGRLIYIASAKRWRLWDGVRWGEAHKTHVDDAAKRISALVVRQTSERWAKDTDDEEAERSLKAAVARHKDLNKVRQIAESAASERDMWVGKPTAFDVDPWLLGVQNGVINLRTGALMRPDPALMLSKQAGAGYDPAAACPLWLKTLGQIFEGDAERIAFVQRLAGYALAGVVDEEIWIFCSGKGANGKSMFSAVLASVFGEYSQTINPEALENRIDSASLLRSATAQLPGKRIAWSNETKEGMVFNDSAMKLLASKDQIDARLLYQETFSFTPTHTLWIRGNHVPGVLDASDGFWRRVVVLPFNRKFEDHEKIKDLDRRIIATEAAGVLAWAVRGCLDWQKNGLKIPASIHAQVEAYRAESDLLGSWMEEYCEKKKGAEVRQFEAYKSYAAYCIDRGFSKISAKSFGRQIDSRGFRRTEIRTGQKILGLELKTVVEADFSDDI